jgi:flavin-binding protein dodecin
MTVAKISEIKASSPKSFDDAIQHGVDRANKTLRNVKSSWIKDFEVLVDGEGKNRSDILFSSRPIDRYLN